MDVHLCPAVILLLLVRSHLIAHERLPAFTHTSGDDLMLQVQVVEDDEEAVVRDVVYAADGSRLTVCQADKLVRVAVGRRIS